MTEQVDGATRSHPPTAAVAVRDNEVDNQFELFVNGAPAGFLTYDMRDESYALTHEEIDPEFQGRGMGSILATGALDLIRESGRGMLPYCPFVAAFLSIHPQYLDLIPPHDRFQFQALLS